MWRRSIRARIVIVGLIAIMILLALPAQTQAHLPGQPSFLKINDSFVDYYPVKQQSSQGIDIPQSTDVNRQLPGKTVRFSIDRKLLAVSNDDAGRMTFDWDFGDGSRAAGVTAEHAYSQPGTYTLRIHGTTADSQRRLIESTAVFVLPDMDFQRPRIYISVNGHEVRNDTEAIDIEAGKEIQLSVRLSPAGATTDSIRWDFGDGHGATGQTVMHTFSSEQREAYVIARATVDGIYYADNAARLAGAGITGPSGPAAWYDAAKRHMEDGLRDIFGSGGINYALAVSVLFFAVIAGAFHSLTPGHGKTVLAALLVGRQGSRYKDLAILAASITIAHTLVIYVIGFILLGLGSSRSVNSLIPYFEKASAILVFALAIYLLATGLRKWATARQHADAHRHSHGSDHEHRHEHHHHSSAFAERLATKGPTWSLIVAGTGGGIVPCIDALSLMLLTAGLGHPGFGLILVLFFSLGLAATISVLGLLLLAGKRKLLPHGHHEQIVVIAAPIMSGCVILLLAIFLLV